MARTSPKLLERFRRRCRSYYRARVDRPQPDIKARGEVYRDLYCKYSLDTVYRHTHQIAPLLDRVELEYARGEAATTIRRYER